MGLMTRTEEQEEAIARGTFIEGVTAEMDAQDIHWGPANTSDNSWAEWSLILGREFGELQKELGLLQFDNPVDPIILLNACHELIQIAAVCAQIIKVIDCELKVR